jgi:hypothetical protein
MVRGSASGGIDRQAFSSLRIFPATRTIPSGDGSFSESTGNSRCYRGGQRGYLSTSVGQRTSLRKCTIYGKSIQAPDNHLAPLLHCLSGMAEYWSEQEAKRSECSPLR